MQERVMTCCVTIHDLLNDYRSSNKLSNCQRLTPLYTNQNAVTIGGTRGKPSLSIGVDRTGRRRQYRKCSTCGHNCRTKGRQRSATSCTWDSGCAVPWAHVQMFSESRFPG